MQFFEYFEIDSPIHRLNPSVKLITIMILMLTVTFVYDPYTPFIFSVLAIIQLVVFAKIQTRQIFKMLAPLSLFLFGIITTSIISYDTTMEIDQIVILNLKGIEITTSSIAFGFTIGFRILCFLLYSLLFVATTDPTDFILSLIIQLKLSPKIGFGTLAGYRFVPLLSTEYQSIHDAHKIRGFKEKSGLVSKFKRFKKYAVPLMVSAARKAQRVAIAMDSKCFNAYPKRTYLRIIRVRRIDIIYIILFTTLCAIIFVLLSKFNIINWGYRSLK